MNSESAPVLPLVRSALILDRSLTNSNLEVDFARSESELIDRINSEKLSYQSIFISSDQPGFSAIGAIATLRHRFPLSPIFLINNDSNPLSTRELRRLGVGDFISRSELEKKLHLKIQRYRQTLPALSQVVQLRAEKVATGAAIPEPFQFKGFRAVLAEDLLSEESCLFDVHMLLPTQKMIKIFAANDSVDIARALSYIASGLHWVYVRESGVQQCVQYCRLFSEILMENTSTSVELKFLHLVSMSESKVKTVPESADSAFELSKSFGKLINRNSELNKLAELLLQHSELLNHSISVTVAALLIAVQLDIYSAHISELIGVAALFHDIGLIELPDHLKTESSNTLSETDMNLYQTHCYKSVRSLEHSGISDATILQAVLQHHERWDKSGFPNRLGAGQIHIFSELVGFSDELVLFLNQNKTENISEFLRLFRKKNFNRFSLRVIEAFDRVFSVATRTP